MTKEEKIKATKEANRLFEIILSVTKNKYLTIACTDIAICCHILNSKGEKLEFWQEARKRLCNIYLRENKQYE